MMIATDRRAFLRYLRALRLPFHPTAPDLGLQFLEETPHGSPHAAWNDGK